MNFTGSEIDRIKSEDLKKPAPLMVTIRGKLTSSIANPDNESKRALHHAFIESKLRELVLWSSEWKEDGIHFNFTRPAYDHQNAEANFLNALNEVMQTKVAIELNFQGYFTVVVDTPTTPRMIRVIVEKSRVSYRRAEVAWAVRNPLHRAISG